MTQPELPPAIYIDTNRALADLVDDLLHETVVAIDTESNSLHAYQARVCLIQLSTRDRDYIIDSILIDDLQPFGRILADASIEKIFHAAEYDLISLHRDFGFEVVNLFDTMYAARICGYKSIGLADLLQEFFDVRPDKSHQRDDWAIRPLPEDSIRYAQMDTHYLVALRDILHECLAQMGRLEEAQEVFRDVLRVEARERDFDQDGFWKIGRPHSLTRRQMAILRELYLTRETLAQEEDLPPFKVMNNRVMVEMTLRPPANYRDLHRVNGLSSRYARLYGDDLLEAVSRGRTTQVPKPPPIERPDPVLSERYITLHAWRKERAQERDVEANIIVSKQTLWELARTLPDTMADLERIDGLGEWRLRQYGEGLLDVIESIRANGHYNGKS